MTRHSLAYPPQEKAKPQEKTVVSASSAPPTPDKKEHNLFELKADNRAVVLYHHSMKVVAENICDMFPDKFRRGMLFLLMSL